MIVFFPMGITFVIFMVFLGGVSAAMQSKVLGMVEEKVGLIGNLLITYLIGFVFSLGIWFSLVFFSSSKFSLSYSGMIERVSQLKWWELTGGLFGLVIVGSIGLGVSRIGVVSTLVILITSQILIGVVLDHFGLFGGKTYPLNGVKTMALTIILIGIFLLLK